MNNILIDRYAERTGISIILFLKEKGLWESVVDAFNPWIYLQELKTEYPYRLEALSKQPVIDYVEQRAKEELASTFSCDLCNGTEYHQCTECGEEIKDCKLTRSTVCIECEQTFNLV